MKVPHLISIRPMECWLATLNESSAILSHALEQIHAAGIVISKSASIACHFLLSRVQLSTCFPKSLSRIHLKASLYLRPADAFNTFCSNKLGILTGTSWHFSNISSDISALWAHESTTKVPHLMSIRPMECRLATLDASSAIMSHALEQTKNARIGVIRQGASSAPHFLLSRVQLSICFPKSLSRIHLKASLYLRPADAFNTFCSNKLGILTGTSWHFSDLSSDISALWAHESTTKVPHLMSIRPMECWLETLNASSATMSHALEQTKDARIGVICQSPSSKLSTSCLHCYSVSIQKIQVFFWKAIFATPPIVLAVTIHTLPWKMRVETCPFSF